MDWLSSPSLSTPSITFQQAEKTGKPNQPFFCISDFVAPLESGVEDYVGMLAVSAGFGVNELCKKLANTSSHHTSIFCICVLKECLACVSDPYNVCS